MIIVHRLCGSLPEQRLRAFSVLNLISNRLVTPGKLSMKLLVDLLRKLCIGIAMVVHIK